MNAVKKNRRPFLNRKLINQMVKRTHKASRFIISIATIEDYEPPL